MKHWSHTKTCVNRNFENTNHFFVMFAIPSTICWHLTSLRILISAQLRTLIIALVFIRFARIQASEWRLRTHASCSVHPVFVSSLGGPYYCIIILYMLIPTYWIPSDYVQLYNILSELYLILFQHMYFYRYY